MNATTFFDSWRGTQMENRFHRLLLMASIAANVVLAIGVTGRDVRVEIAPTPLPKEATITADSASPEMLTAWGMYMTSLLGNANPKSAKFLTETIASNLAPDIYTDVVAAIDKQADMLREEQLSVSFTPTATQYDGKRGIVAITGEQVTTGPSRDSQRILRTYELGFEVKNYKVLLNNLDVYDGRYQPRREVAAN